MDLHKMIAELEAERDRLTEAIEVLERLSSEAKARGRRAPQAPKDGESSKGSPAGTGSA